MEAKRLIKNIDFLFLAFIAGILIMSCFVLSSATLNVSNDPLLYVKKHIVWIAAGLTGMICLTIFNYNNLRGYWKPIYFASLGSASCCSFRKKAADPIGSFQLQP